MSLSINSVETIGETSPIVAMPEHRWYPVYCRPNKEQKLYEFALEHGIPCYLPKILKHRVTRGRRISTPIPMFAGYVFLCTNRQQNWMVKQSKHVVRVLPVTEMDEHKLIAELNIVQIYEDLARTRKIEIRPEIIPGKKVVITHGKLRGIEGIVEKRKNAYEIIIQLAFLGCSLATVEAGNLELA